jgi:hypothetical protein
MPSTPPVLAGSALPLPNGHERTPIPVESTVELAGGGRSRYHRGHRVRVELEWRSLTTDAADTLDAAVRRTRGATQYVDIDGTPYVVLVEEYSGRDAVPGTDPVRYRASLTVEERGPR